MPSGTPSRTQGSERDERRSLPAPARPRGRGRPRAQRRGNDRSRRSRVTRRLAGRSGGGAGGVDRAAESARRDRGAGERFRAGPVRILCVTDRKVFDGGAGGRPRGSGGDLQPGAAAPDGDRLPDAGQSHRGRGPGPGGVVALAGRGSQRGPEPGRLPVDCGDQARDQREPVRPGPPGDLYRSVAAGTGRHQRRPTLGAERGEALSFAVLLVLERLSPTERAAYILREAFDYPYDELAAILQSSEAAVRQLVSRARKRIRAERRAEVSGSQQKKLLTAFVAAARSGDLKVLEQLLAKDAISYSDGGGAARASKFPVVGWSRVAKYVRAFHDRFWVGVEVEFGTANGQSVALLRRDGEVFTVLTVVASDEGIDEVLWIMNPAKLTAVA